MGAIGRLTGVGSLLAVLVAAALILGFLIGQPVLLSYVETESMEPTIGAGDGFVVVPAVAADDPEPGDVVVFDAHEVGGGGLTTHRVIGTTDGGYVTRGDGNPFTDQDDGEPPVTDEQIVATALTIDGEVVVVSNLGTAVMEFRGGLVALQSSVGDAPGDASEETVGLSYLLLAVGLAMIVGSFLFGSRREPAEDRDRNRNRPDVYRTRRVIAVVAVVAVVAATLAMTIPAGPVQYTIVSATTPAPADPLSIEAGTQATISEPVHNDGVLPVVVVREEASNGLALERSAYVVAPRSTVDDSVTIAAPDEPGVYRETMTERRYLAVLPPSLLVALHSIHPWLAIAAVDAVLALAILLVGSLVGRTEYVRLRSRDRPRSLRYRLFRRFH